MTKWDLPHKCKVGLISENMTHCVNEGEQMQKKKSNKNPAPIHDKNCQTTNRKEFSQLDKGCLQKTKNKIRSKASPTFYPILD